MKDKYLYFVTYFSKRGEGRATIRMDNKIRSNKDVERVEKIIESVNEEEVGVTNFILLDTKWGFCEWLVFIAELGLLVVCVLTLIASFFV